MDSEEINEERDGISRRTMLKRIGAGAAIAWTVPVLSSINVPAFAATSESCANQTCFRSCGDNIFICSSTCGDFGTGICFTDTEGACVCAANDPCGSHGLCNSSADCAGGSVCLPASTCCGQAVCEPLCSSSAPKGKPRKPQGNTPAGL